MDYFTVKINCDQCEKFKKDIETFRYQYNSNTIEKNVCKDCRKKLIKKCMKDGSVYTTTSSNIFSKFICCK